MKRRQIVLIALLTTGTVYGQEVISSQGDSYSNANGSLDFTIGEVVINTETDGSNVITQGFHQTNWNFLGVDDHSSNYDAIIYPNPTLDVLNIRASSFENVTFTLYDAQGKLILQDVLTAIETSVQVSELPMGSYSLTLNNEAQKLKTFKLVKTQ